jgi:ankyrin repeat protein
MDNINRCDHNGHTLMHIACTYNDIETVKFLIATETKQNVYAKRNVYAIVNAIDNNGWNPLRTVSHFGYIELLKILLKTQHCNVNDAYNNRTALFYASLSCHTDVVTELSYYGAEMYVNNTVQIAYNCNYDKYCDIYMITG